MIVKLTVNPDPSEVSLVLNAMVDTLSGSALRAGARTWGRIMSRATRNNISRGQFSTGTLKRNITYKVLTIKRRKITMAIVGARRGIVVTFGKRKLIPSRYFHLYEKGHKKGRGKAGAVGFYPLRRAYTTFKQSARVEATRVIITDLENKSFKRLRKGKRIYK